MKPLQELLRDLYLHQKAQGTLILYPLAVLLILPFAIAAWAMGELK